MRRKFLGAWICLFALVITALASCRTDSGRPEDSSTTGEEITMPDVSTPTALSIVKNGHSDYVIVADYRDKAAKNAAIEIGQLFADQSGVNLRISDAAEAEHPHEIVIGAAREATGDALAENDFAVDVSGEKLYFRATDATMYSYLACYLKAELLPEMTANQDIFWARDTGFQYSLSALAQTGYVEYYQSVYNTYSSYTRWFLKNAISPADLRDTQLVDALIAWLGDGFAVSVGSSSALYNGFVVKLDRSDYQKLTCLDGNDILIASDFANRYFGMPGQTDDCGMSNLTALCREKGYTLLTDSESGISVVFPPESAPVQSDDQFQGFSVKQLFERMEKFFRNRYLPEPETSVEQSRVVIDSTDQKVSEILDYTKARFECFDNPQIVALERDGKTLLYAAYQKSTRTGMMTSLSMTTVIQVSENLGATWKTVHTLGGFGPQASFVFNGKIYLAGSKSSFATLVCYDPVAGSAQQVNLGIACNTSGPMEALLTSDRVYIPYNRCVVSAPLSADLMNPSSWAASSPVDELITKAWWLGTGVSNIFSAANYVYEEGSVTEGRDGTLYVIYRQNHIPGYAVILHLSRDGQTLSYVEECNSLISFPTAITNFKIVYDPASDRYISLVNLYTGDSSTYYANTYGVNQRTVLALAVSEDLFHWETASVLLVDREMMNTVVSNLSHGFQYSDFVALNGNLYLVVRETVGEAVWFYHEAPYVTFYRVEDYLSLIRSE